MKDRELWINKLKEKLEDYTEPIPDSGWEQLEKELVSPVEKRIYPYRRWAMAAVAVMLVAVSSVSLFFLNSPVAEEIRYMSVPTLATMPDGLPQSQKPAVQIAKVKLAKVIHPVVVGRRGNNKLFDNETVVSEDTAGTVTVEIQDHSVVSAEKAEPVIIEELDTTEQKTVKAVRRPSGKDKLHLPEKTSLSKRGKWSMGASIGNAGSVSNNRAEMGEGVPMMSQQRVNLASAENGMLQIPSDKTLIFKEGMPYFQVMNEVFDIEHHQPISLGISVRRGLAKGFSIETGIMYTLLSSDVKLYDNATMTDQKLHYLGIPLKANWNFVDKKLFTLYVSAGGMVEKCLSGKLAGQKVRVNPLQFSVTGAVGAQFNASKWLGIYVEPGVAYFFDDSSSVQTIRKKTPFNLNIQGGVRFTY